MFKNLRNISCKKYLRTFRKGNKVIQYLPWEVCWDNLKEIYPSAKSEWVMYEYDSKPFGGVMSPDGSVIVHCRITIDFKGKEITHNEYLSVKSRANREIIFNPTAQDMELTYRKAIGRAVSMMTGFGLDYWLDQI